MISITLTGDDVISYINLKDNYNELLLKYAKLESKQVSQKVLDDSQKAKDVSKPAFATPKSVYNLPIQMHAVEQGKPKTRTNSRWSKEDLGIIYAALTLTPTNQDRRVSVLAGKLNRSYAAVATKCTELGLRIKNKMVFSKEV